LVCALEIIFTFRVDLAMTVDNPIYGLTVTIRTYNMQRVTKIFLNKYNDAK